MKGSASMSPQHERSVKLHDCRKGLSPLYLRAREMALLLDLPLSSFRKYVNDGLLPDGIKIGRNKIWRVDTMLSAIEEYDLHDEVDRGKNKTADPCALQTQQARKQALLLPVSQGEARRRSSEATPGQSAFAGVLGRT